MAQLLLLHWRTSLGPRTIPVEISDAATAQAIRAAHEALGEMAALVDEIPRQSLADYLAKHKRRKAKAALKALPANVTRIGKVAGK